MNDAQALESLLGDKCPACDGSKERKQSVCRDCYFKLPKEMRTRLYKRIYMGYRQAVNQALDYLEKLRFEEKKNDRTPSLF